MRALVTGASSGLGLAVCRELARRGFAIVGCSRHEGDFRALREEFPAGDFEYIEADLSSAEGRNRLLNSTQGIDFDLYFVNSGFGCFGSFMHAELDAREAEMAELNCISSHLLIKEFLRKAVKAQRGRVMVTASAAAFASAPYMSAYYATKAYIYHLCLGYQRELQGMKTRVTLSILCPGPVATRFEETGKLKFQIKPMKAEKVASYAVKKWLRGKKVIVPWILMKFGRIGAKLVPDTLVTKFTKRAAE